MNFDQPPASGLFIAGSDTGVGKTVVSVGLVRIARNLGIRCVGVKPVETGCALRAGQLHPEDGYLLQKAAGGSIDLDDCAPFRFSIPASPFRAAALEGRKLFLVDMEEHIRTLQSNWELVIVEAAGGLMVPIQDHLMNIDLVERLGYPTVLVGRAGLGTINHTLLSLHALRNRGIEPAGIVICSTEKYPGPEEDYTPTDLARLAGNVPVIHLPYLGVETAGDPGAIAAVMEKIWPRSLLLSWFIKGP
jgi:dethiobiotin synthetase